MYELSVLDRNISYMIVFKLVWDGTTRNNATMYKQIIIDI